MTVIDTSICPNCQQLNQCAFGLGQPAESCWCMQGVNSPEQEIEPEARNSLLLVPTSIKNTRCYCQSCLEKIKASRQALQDLPVRPDHT